MHDHNHDHSHHFDTHNRSFALAVVLNTLFVVIEAVYGVLSGSLALTCPQSLIQLLPSNVRYF